MTLKFGKGANVQEIAFIVGIALAFGVMILLGFKLIQAGDQAFQKIGIVPDDAKESIHKTAKVYPGLMDKAFLIILIIFFVITVMSAYYIDVHPFFFILSLVVLVGALVSSYMITEANKDIISNEIFADIVDQFPIIVYVGMHLFQIAVIMAGIIAIALYAKSRSGEG
jgi:hypothetical protein